ncbi:heavy metal translocating P-type ATPase [Erythrobacter arachoides]|uniref:P-type Zn(2+) transporter n=1 Tax=Aurantiacibacter arachoides TaxID=1850444 RepID=A0A845A1W5_9SPHN|nr:heavy metal translocating P-type ATPase [Aurantiacibacter arachoides]MXO93918.1 heavy metal translocating P-type ATPase [Aurantiacibacter arachoides]GGD45611.1 ATPase [Aurantiacibacter arachoides]
MTEHIRLYLPLLLPTIPDEADRCVARLLDELTQRDGVGEAHVIATAEDEPAKLCVHFNPEKLGLAQVRKAARASGATLTARFGHLVWQVDGIEQERRARTVSETLYRLEGVFEAQATASGAVRVEFDRSAIDEARIGSALASLGVRRRQSETAATSLSSHADASAAAAPPVPGGKYTHEQNRDAERSHEHGEGSGHAHGSIFGSNTELYFALISGAALATGFALSWTGAAPEFVSTGLYLAAYFFGGFFTVREAFDSLKLRRFEIDTLMLVAAAGAAALGEFAEGALLLFLFSLGHALEHYAMGRAKKAIEALAELAPQTAVVRRGSATEEVLVEALAIGDVVVVKPNERLPADGFVIEGTSSVNQAPVTGESVPVDKQPVPDAAAAAAAADSVAATSRIFAGTINGSGALAIHVTRLSSDTTLAKVVKLVSEAETQKSPTQRFTDRFERIFVPLVLGLVVILLFAGAVIDEPFSATFYRAMAVLVAASPCALAIATPSAVLSGVARAARGGVLVKGGGPLENLGGLNAIAFDKTGTLTEGRPRVTDVVEVADATEQDLLRTAVAVEVLSDHPLAAAIVRDGTERLEGPAAKATDLKSITGRGVEAVVDGEVVHIGRDELFSEAGGTPLPQEVKASADELRAQGRTIMITRQGARYLGVIGLMDTPRESAPATTARLRELGITRMIMLSGDATPVAKAVAASVGIEDAWGDLMPEDKVEAIKKLRTEEGKVAMVGDGVNDAPALATATVGIAMGAAGSDVALETADVALMADDLAKLPFAVDLSRRTRRIIRQNVFVSMGVVALLLPATILGLGIGPAVIAHEGSTLLVVFNALRLLAFREVPFTR